MKNILLLVAALSVVAACGSKKAGKPVQQTSSYLKNAKGDSTLYGLACDGTTDSILVLLPYTGADPDTLDMIDASQNKRIFGKPFIGDELAVILNPEDKKEVYSVINLNYLKGEWAFLVKPKLREYDNLPRRLKRRMMAEMPDSVKESLLIPREYSIQIKRGNSVMTKGMKRMKTTDDMSAVEYPEIKRYTEWKLYNGRLILIAGHMHIEGESEEEHVKETRDTANIIQLTRDTLVLRFNDGDWGFYNKDTGK